MYIFFIRDFPVLCKHLNKVSMGISLQALNTFTEPTVDALAVETVSTIRDVMQAVV